MTILALAHKLKKFETKAPNASIYVYDKETGKRYCLSNLTLEARVDPTGRKQHTVLLHVISEENYG